MNGQITGMEGETYTGPATLTPRGETREYAVNARIRESYEAEWDPDHDVKVSESRKWTAYLDGQMPDPPYGECVLRLPDGREGKGSFGHVRGTATTWEGRLWAFGPSPTSAPVVGEVDAR